MMPFFLQQMRRFCDFACVRDANATTIGLLVGCECGNCLVALVCCVCNRDAIATANVIVVSLRM